MKNESLKYVTTFATGELLQRGNGVRLGPNQGKITGQTYDSYDQSARIRPPEAAGSVIIVPHTKPNREQCGKYVAVCTTHPHKRV